MALAEIERLLLEQWHQLGGPRGFEYCNHIDSPAELAAAGDWDLILWAGGRWSLDDVKRKELGCGMRVGEAEDVLVFELRGFGPARRGDARPTRLEDLAKLAATDLTSAACQAAASAAPEAGASCQFKVVLRFARDGDPGAGGAKGKAPPPVAWLWLLGLPAELKAAKAAAGTTAGKRPRKDLDSMPAALNVELECLGIRGEGTPGHGPLVDARWLPCLQAAVTALQERIFFPSSVSVRWVDASYWSADQVVCSLPVGPGKCTPLVLIGDAAMGKPFYTGTTLNVHLAEVKALSRLPVIRWGTAQDAGPGDDDRRRARRYLVDESLAAITPLLPYEQRYRELLLRTPAFHRRQP
uniref:Uncharacterized protein n=2 Tax=Alexandrium monilatum TaxID=311494 RepID=A0A7S4UCF7_9DINO